MKRMFWFIILILMLLPTTVHANQSAFGWCEIGNRTVSLSGLTSVTKVQQSFPACTVTVYLHGTVTLATLYSNNAVSPTPLANPFTANTNGSWQWYAANGEYDAVLSGAGFPSPFTIYDVLLTGNITSVNVLTYGAQCDGITNDTTAFSNANTALATNGGVLIVPAGRTCVVNSLTFSPKVDVSFESGANLSIVTSYTVTFNGSLTATPTTIFTGDGSVSIASSSIQVVYPQWWGATGDNSHDDTTAINAALAAVITPTAVFLPGGTYKVTNVIIVPASTIFYGLGPTSEIVSAIPGASSVELVRLAGDYAAIEKIWLHGVGQGSGASVDGNRGIWIGCSSPPHTGGLCNVNYARVENTIIDAFTGNGISGDYTYAKIVNNDIHNNTDANVFFQPGSTNNLLQGNTIYNSRYSGVDDNGSNNRIVNNTIYSNGGGALDTNSWNGVLVDYVPTDATQPNATNNIVADNTIQNNQGCGILVFGLSGTSGMVNAPFGNVISGNNISGHTTYTGSPSGSAQNQWFGGICLEGSEETTVVGNESHDNTFNYVVASTSTGNNTAIQLIGNQSYNALTNAGLTGLGQPSGVGYFFPGASRLDGVGGYPVNGLILTGNWDRYAASDSYRVDLALATGVTWAGHVWRDNHSDHAGGYGFNMVSPNNFLNFIFDQSNYATNATSGAQAGWARLGLAANSATPSVANGLVVFTQNTTSTTITNFTGGSFGQHINVLVNDNNTTFKFTSGTLKGNAATNFMALSGDSLDCTYDLTNWYCTINGTRGYPQGSGNGVGQATSKSTGVTSNSVSGQITMNNAALNAGTSVSFTLTDSQIVSSSDQLRIQIIGGPHPGLYTVSAAVAGVGSATITVTNVSSGNSSDAIVLGFNILRQY